MRNLLLIAGVMALAAPVLAMAQDGSMAPGASQNGADVAYSGGPGELMAREARLDRAIHDGDVSGAISHQDAMRDRDLLSAVRQRQGEMASSHGGLTADDRMAIGRQLDSVRSRMRLQMGGSF